MQDKMSDSLEDYLEAILVLEQEHGGARVKDIASMLNVKMSSVNNAINILKRYEFVTQEPYSMVLMTETGKRVAMQILNRHEVLTNFLKTLGVPEETAEMDACQMEHILSDITFKKIEEFLKKK